MYTSSKVLVWGDVPTVVQCQVTSLHAWLLSSMCPTSTVSSCSGKRASRQGLVAAGKSSDEKFWCHHTQKLLGVSETCHSQYQLRLQGFSHKPVAVASVTYGMANESGAAGCTRERDRIQKCLQDAVGVAAGKLRPALHVCSRIKVGWISIHVSCSFYVCWAARNLLQTPGHASKICICDWLCTVQSCTFGPQR